ncbi:MAG: T9SS type A sorting domain-containing protein, partial [Bacteroidaceae bacterium]|nr:T9SS type A sorting domain-containing protein [Bacteroidaceae bacterium]
NVVGTEVDNCIKYAYPNPFKDSLYLQPEKAGIYDISLLDLDGKEVMHRQVNISEGQTIEIKPDIAPGVYIVIVTTGKEIVGSTKVVKK